MKRFVSIIVLLAVFSISTFAQGIKSYPMANGHKVNVLNLLKESYHQYFDHDLLVRTLEKLSEDYGLSTDFDIGLNVSATGIFLTVQGITIDPLAPSKYSPVLKDGKTYLPLRLQLEAFNCAAQWFVSFVQNPFAPAEVRTFLNRLSMESTSFLVGITQGLRTLNVRGRLSEREGVRFEPKIEWQDFSVKGVFTMKTIPIPQNAETYAALSEWLLYLEPSEDPGNPGFKQDIAMVRAFFGLE